MVGLSRGNYPENLATFGKGDVKDTSVHFGEHVVANLAVVLPVIPNQLPGRIDKADQHIGEIDTGDTLVFVEGGWEDRKAAEIAAVTRIFGMLPEDQGASFLALWQEFEGGETPEARFARAVDRAMPVLQNLANEGQSWRENGITYERVVRRIAPPIKAGCPALWEYLEVRLEEARRRGVFGA